MPVFVVEAGGQAVAAIAALSLPEAEAHARSQGFQFNLRMLERKGVPLWDGQAELQLRPPTTREQRMWDAGSGDRDVDLEHWINARVPFGDD